MTVIQKDSYNGIVPLDNISGYGEVSVDTDLGKVFAVAFALVGIPLMFITAADIGKFLSETLLRFVSNWNKVSHKMKVFIGIANIVSLWKHLSFFDKNEIEIWKMFNLTVSTMYHNTFLT